MVALVSSAGPNYGSKDHCKFGLLLETQIYLKNCHVSVKNVAISDILYYFLTRCARKYLASEGQKHTNNVAV